MTTSRRAFLKTSSAGVAGFLLTRSIGGRPSAGESSLNFGYISGIVREELNRDWKGTLSKTVEYGFEEIEIGSPPDGATVEEFVEHCAQIGLKPVAGGVPFTTDADQLRQKLETLTAMGMSLAISYWPWSVSAPFSLKDCRESAETLNRMGEICKEQGMTLCWHNHDREFSAMEQGLPFDYLMNNTDEGLVKCELDVYWAAKGGADPVEYLKKYTGRYPILHLKDMTGDEERTFECVGDGIIDFPSILKEAKSQGIEHFMVERDKVKDGLACLRSSSRYLHSLSV